MISIPKHLSKILSSAAKRAMPELTLAMDVEAERNKEWDYKSASAMKFFNMYKKKGSFGFASCKDMADAIVSNIKEEENDAIEKIDLAMVGKGDPAKCGYFLNITLKKNFIEDQIKLINTASQLELASAKAAVSEQ